MKVNKCSCSKKNAFKQFEAISSESNVKWLKYIELVFVEEWRVLPLGGMII